MVAGTAQVDAPTGGPEQRLDTLAREASYLGFEVVDIDGLLETIEDNTSEQSAAVERLALESESVSDANMAVQQAVHAVESSTDGAMAAIESSIEGVRTGGEATRDLASWVATLDARVRNVEQTLDAVRASNNQIATIAKQVNILAINAKIEAARAGDAGRGFAVVAEAINELSQKTAGAALGIQGNVGELTEWIDQLRVESEGAARKAQTVLGEAGKTDEHLLQIGTSVTQSNEEARRIISQTERVTRALDAFGPAVAKITQSIAHTNKDIAHAHDRTRGMIDRSERILQGTVAAGGVSGDAHFIEHVQIRANEIGLRFAAAVNDGRISMDDLFSTTLTPIEGTNPPQVMAPFTALADALLPDLLEDSLNFDSTVVFCVAVDTQGYLPTHNRQFSQPQGDDPTWNMANSRNRRVFDDRVGLKAGQNTEPFLLQVYRRDMGGGDFMLMKDLSAPIFVNGRHWGGLRLAYSPA